MIKLNKIKYFAFALLIIILFNCSLIIAENYSISVDSNKNNYYRGEDINISGFLKFNGAGVSNLSVGIEIRYIDNSMAFLELVSTNENGGYSAIYQIKDVDRIGNYTIFVANEGTARANTTFKITNDYISPSSVTNLSSISIDSNSITWKWNNPTDSDFYYNLIFINGINVINTSSNTYTSSGLSPSTRYTITLHTIDYQDNINNSNVSYSATTLASAQTPENSGGGGGGGGGGGSILTPTKNINKTIENKENNSINKIEDIEKENKQILFDILIKTIKRDISQKEKLTISISLINFGVQGKVNASLYYMIKDNQGNIYFETRETIPVETQLEFVKEFDVSNLKEGTYTIVADLAYKGQKEPATSEDTFTIVKKRNYLYIALVGLEITAVLACAGVLFFILFKRKMQKEGKWEGIKIKWKKYWKNILEKIKMMWKKVKNKYKKFIENIKTFLKKKGKSKIIKNKIKELWKAFLEKIKILWKKIKKAIKSKKRT